MKNEDKIKFKDFVLKLEKSNNFWFIMGLILGYIIAIIFLLIHYGLGSFDNYLKDDYTMSRDNYIAAKAEEPLAVYDYDLVLSSGNLYDSIAIPSSSGYCFFTFGDSYSSDNVIGDIDVNFCIFAEDFNVITFFSTLNWSDSFGRSYFITNNSYNKINASFSVPSANFNFGSFTIYNNSSSSSLYLFSLNISFNYSGDVYNFHFGDDSLFNTLYDYNLVVTESAYSSGFDVGFNSGYDVGESVGYGNGYTSGYLDGYNEALDSTDYTESISFDSYFNFMSFYTQNDPNYWISLNSDSLIANVGDIAFNNPPSYLALFFDFSNYIEGYSYNFNAVLDITQYFNNLVVATSDVYSSSARFNVVANFDYTDYALDVDLTDFENKVNFDLSNVYFTPNGTQEYFVLIFYNQVVYYDEFFRITDFNLIGEFTFDSRLDKAFNDGVQYADSRTNVDSQSYIDGLDNGYKSGYNDGLNKGSDYSFGSFFFGIIDAPIRAVLSMFDFEIFGTNIRTFMLVIFSIVAVITLIRVLYKFKFGD